MCIIFESMCSIFALPGFKRLADPVLPTYTIILIPQSSVFYLGYNTVHQRKGDVPQPDPYTLKWSAELGNHKILLI